MNWIEEEARKRKDAQRRKERTEQRAQQEFETLRKERKSNWIVISKQIEAATNEFNQKLVPDDPIEIQRDSEQLSLFKHSIPTQRVNIRMEETGISLTIQESGGKVYTSTYREYIIRLRVSQRTGITFIDESGESSLTMEQLTRELLGPFLGAYKFEIEE